MPDITMCSGQHCPLREDCYRHTAKPNKHRQSYFKNPPVIITEKDGEEVGECDHQWKNYKD